MASGEYQGTQNLELIKGNPSDKLYYTLDGSEPGITSTEYTAPIALQPGDITIKVIEVNEVGVKSPVQENKYLIKQSKLSNEEFISKLYGVWYQEDLSGRLIYFSNKHIRIGRWGSDPSDGDFQIENTTENGGTIYIADFQAEGTHRSAKIIFDFGTPGDNRINVTNDAGIRSDYIAAEYLGNNQYRLPASLNIPGNITTMN